MPKKIIRYKCDYCKKTYANKSAAKRHEWRCFFNPATKSCATCKNADMISDDNDEPVDWCRKINSRIFRKGWAVVSCHKWEPIEYIEENFADEW